MIPRRTLTVTALVLACAALRGPARAQGGAGQGGPGGSGAATEGRPAVSPIPREREDPAVRSAIERGLRFLSSKQTPSGAVGSNYEAAVTALSGMAVLGAGHGYRGGPPHARKLLEGALGFLKGSVREDGYLSDPKSRMHGHCYAVLFLTQVYGELPQDEQAQAASITRRGLEIIRRSQSSDGGWYYAPRNEEQDEASITICALQALRAANGIGLVVPRNTVDRAVSYVKRCQNADGSFRYSLRGPDQHPSYALTVAAVSTLHAAGIYDAPEVGRGLDYARRALAGHPGEPTRAAEKEFLSYANLYAAQAYYQAGGDLWAAWHPAAKRWLLKRQGADGGWSDDYGAEFGTAVALLILEVPLNYLPVFQR